MWEKEDIKKVLFSNEEITERCKVLADEIKKDYENRENPLLLVALLRGSVPFLSELIKHIDMDIQYDFMDVTSYEGTESQGDIKSFSEAYLKDIDNIILNKNDFMIELDNKYLLAQDEGKSFVVEKKSGYSFKYNSLDELEGVSEAFFKVIEGVMGVNAVTLKDEDFPITIRNYEEGDRIELRFGTKKVNRFFIDRKIPKYKRDTWPIVLNSENKVILVPGLGCDISHYSIKPSISVIQYYK